MLKIPRFIKSYILRGYEEFQSHKKFLTPEEEKWMVARLIGDIHVKFLGVSEYTDFEDDAKTRSKIVTRFLKFQVLFVVISLFLTYGAWSFVIVGMKDDELKSWVLIGASNLFLFTLPPFIVMSYIVQSGNMIELVRKYSTSCREINGNKRKFYKDLTVKMKVLQNIMQLNFIFSVLYLYTQNVFCFKNDLRFVCDVFTPLWYPFETNYFPVREIFVLLTMLYFSYFGLLFVHAINDTYILAELYEYKAKILMKLMRKTSLSRHQNIEIVRDKFHKIVRTHQELYECFLLMKDILGDIAIPSVVSFVPFFAAHLTVIIKDPNTAFIDEILATIFLFYMWCHSLQKINDVGEELPDVAYGMDWYEMDKRMNKDFLIFLMKLGHPMKMKCLVFIMNKPILLSLIRCMYSFLMLILNVN